MTVITGTITDANPSDAFSDMFKTLVGAAGVENWSFIENIPANAIANEMQTIEFNSFDAGDTIRLTYNGHETIDITYSNDISLAIENALEALEDFDAGDINAVKSTVARYYIDFQGTKAGCTMLPLTVTNGTGGATGTASVTNVAINGTGSTSFSCDVFKCSGSGTDANDAGFDWYMGILRYGAVTASGLQIFIAEEYDSALLKFKKIGHYLAGNSNQLSIGPNKYIKAGTTELDAYATVSSQFSYIAKFVSTINTTGFTYYIVLTNNYLAVSTLVGTTEKFGFLGLFESLVVDNSLATPAIERLPLVLVGNGINTSGSDGSFIYLPNVTPADNPFSVFGIIGLPWNRGATLGIKHTTNYTDLWNNVPISRIGLFHKATLINLYGFTRGALPSEILCMYKGTVVLGDTLTITDNTLATPVAEEWTVIGQIGNSYSVIARSL